MIALLGGLAVAGCATSQPPPSWDGLELRPAKGIDAVYLKPGADFARYRTVLIEPVQVAFKDTWNPNQGERGASRNLSISDVQQLRENMASAFRKTFADELARGGYTTTDRPDDDTLRVTAALANVYIAAPARDSFGPSRTYTVESGEMTLVLELRDSVSGELLGRVVDRKTGIETGRLQMTTSTTNRADFDRAVSSWARRLRAGLDAVHVKAP
ncbi:MAG: DUF3313 family protein [Deltaproteobacteria bacterium]|nr:DUF3313 family protein [Deltaproteobacteria bacterium]